MKSPDLRNTPVLRHFGLDPAARNSIAPWDIGPEPFMLAGSHPDVVDRLWNQLGAVLPQDCRCRVGHSPALAHPRTGLLIGVALGTRYALRLPEDTLHAALGLGATQCTVWSGGSTLDLGTSFGKDWVFGAWLKDEPAWCRRIFDAESGA